MCILGEGGVPAQAFRASGSLRYVRIDVFTIFPTILEGPLQESLLGKAVATGLVDVRVHDLRDGPTDRHRSVDDEAFGGGPGMVLKPAPIFEAVESLESGPGQAARSSRRPDGGSTRRWCASSRTSRISRSSAAGTRGSTSA